MTLLEELKAIDDIRQLKSRYFRFLDTKDWTGMSTVFCRDAIFDLRSGSTVDPDDGSPQALAAADYVLKGVNEIVGSLRGNMSSITSVHQGHCHEVWIDSTDAARGVIAMEDINTNIQTGELIVQGYGHYHETYQHEDGAWRILHSRLTRLKVTFGPAYALL